MACVPFKFQTKALKIICNTGAYIEITDDDLITLIEKARIIDDLWLVMNGVIQEMPLQEESRNDKEMLRQRRLEFLKDNPSIRRGKA